MSPPQPAAATVMSPPQPAQSSNVATVSAEMGREVWGGRCGEEVQACRCVSYAWKEEGRRDIGMMCGVNL